MKTKQLIFLGGIAVVLIGLATLSSKNATQRTAAPALGSKVLPALADKVNDVEILSIQTPATTTTAARIDGLWRIPSKWNYPADFSKIRAAMNKLVDLKVLQSIRTTASARAEFNLLTTADTGSTNRESCATRIALQGSDGRTLAQLDLGKTRSRPESPDSMGMGSYPDSRYVMNAAGQVMLVGDTLDEFASSVQPWLDMEFATLNDVLAIEVKPATQPGFAIERTTPEAEFTFKGATPAGKVVEPSKLSQTGTALSYIRFEDVADPKLSPAVTGLDKPDTFRARSRNGEVVMLRVGRSPVGETTRYATVSVAFEPPVTPAASGTNQAAVAKAQADQNTQVAATAKALNEKLSPWIYLISKETADSLCPQEKDLFTDKKDTKPSTETK